MEFQKNFLLFRYSIIQDAWKKSGCIVFGLMSKNYNFNK